MHVTHPLIEKDKIRMRRYQESVVAAALTANTLVVLPTGLGKTIVAAMVAAQKLIEQPKYKILFLAPTRPLAVQHKKTFEELMRQQSMAVLTGATAISKRQEMFKQSTLIFATPQTIENDIIRGLDLSNVSLIIFDEAHRAVGEYAYVYIAQEYLKQAKKPHILGLTASPSSRKEKVDEVCKNLGITRVEAKTEHDRDVKPYIQDVNIQWIRVELPDEFKKIKKLIEDILRDELKELKNLGYLKSSNLKRANKKKLLAIQAEIRKDITSGIDAYTAASTAAAAIKIHHALELLETQGMSSLNSYFMRLTKQKSKAVRRMMADPLTQHIMKTVKDLTVLGVDHPKLSALTELVDEHKGEKTLVFTQYRDSVGKIVERLSETGSRVHEFIGQSDRGTGKGMTQKKQLEVLEKFREGEYQILVCTSVAEEGLDIPKVDLVVFYEPVPSEIRTIQRRGRTGRTTSGKVAVLLAKDTRDEGYYWASVHKERRMEEIVKKMRDGGDETQKTIVEYKQEEDTEPAEDSGNENNKMKAFGQQSILQYGFEKGENLKIYVDTRERSKKIITQLKEQTEIEIRQLPVGDYLLSDRAVVERKTVDDFLQSIIDKRLLAQARELTRNFSKPFMIIEGLKDIYTQRSIHPNAIRGAMVSLALDFNITVLSSKDEEDTAGLLIAIAKREQDDEDRVVALRGEKKPMLLDERQQFIVESLPNVSGTLAQRLLKQFGSVKNVMNASLEKLRKVEGIGEVKASEIRKALTAKYEGRI